jgi:O-antigen/teichoic acid export membrane protein
MNPPDAVAGSPGNEPAPTIASSLLRLGRQSLVYGLGSVVARFASLLLLPLYSHYLTQADYGAIETMTALVAVAVTLAQFGMVNALFRFALARDDDERWATVRTALAFCAISGLVFAAVAALLTPWAADAMLGGRYTLWLVSCAGLLISLTYEPTAGIYRLQQQPRRYLMITLVNVGFTVLASVLGVVLLHAGAVGLVAGSYAGTLVALAVVLSDRWSLLRGRPDWALLRPMLEFGLPFVPTRLALWGLNLSNRLLLLALSSQAMVGLFAFGVRISQAVALLVTAFQLAWPPYAYSIRDDDEARVTYRIVVTYWLIVSSWMALALALLRHPLLALFAKRWHAAANPMAISAVGLVFYGAFYAVAVATGRVSRTRPYLVVTAVAASANAVLCLALIPHYGPSGAATASAIAYALMAVLMAIYAERAFPVGYQWRRSAFLLGLAAALFLAADRALPQAGLLAACERLAATLAYPAALFALGGLSEVSPAFARKRAKPAP